MGSMTFLNFIIAQESVTKPNWGTVLFCVESGSYCMTCGSDKTLRLWNPHKSLLIKTYMGHGAEVLDADA